MLCTHTSNRTSGKCCEEKEGKGLARAVPGSVARWLFYMGGGRGQGAKERQVAFGGEGALPHETTEPKCPSVKAIYS